MSPWCSLRVLLATLSLAACSSAPSRADAGDLSDAGEDGAQPADAQPASDASDGAIDKAANCASTFGNAIGSVGFARFDGTVVAVLAPGNMTCAAPNSTHVVIEVRFAGAVYRMVVAVNDLSSPGTIRTKTISHALVGGPWSDGWHAVPLDYPSMLGVHSNDFASTPTAVAVAEITDALTLGARVSIFATAQGQVDSAHLIHRTKNNQDGAIVVDVDGSPKWLLSSFSNYTF